MEPSARVLVMTTEGNPSGPARVLAALRVAEPTCRIRMESGVDAASEAMNQGTFDAVLVSEDVVLLPDWSTICAGLREAAGTASIIALVAGRRPRGADDVLDPTQPEPNHTGRVLRYAVSHARAQEALAQATAQLSRWAMQDPLTGLMNRRGLENTLVQVFAGRERGAGPVALLLDCDDFKSVNDGYGHAAGDAVLKAIGTAIADTVRAGDHVARVGGDEFMVILPDARTWEAMEVAERVRRRVIDRVRAIPDDLPDVSVSIGVQRLSLDLTSVTEVVRLTQEALKASKSGGKNRVTLKGSQNTPPPMERSLTPMFGKRRVDYEIERVGVLSNGKLAGWEIRSAASGGEAEQLYRHTVKRAALPNVDLAWVRSAIRRAPDGQAPVHISVYPSTLQQMGHVLISELPRNMSAERLRVVIDEQFLSGDPWQLRRPLSELRKQGVGFTLSICDFGRNTLECLILLRPEVVRIDRQRITGVSGSVPMKAGLRRFLRVCDSLGSKVIACGVQTELDLDTLRTMDVEYGSGPAVYNLQTAK